MLESTVSHLQQQAPSHQVFSGEQRNGLAAVAIKHGEERGMSIKV